LTALLVRADLPTIHHYSSGHPDIDDLARLVDVFSTARAIPICSEAAHVEHEWWDV
jgi:hypothetical protein